MNVEEKFPMLVPTFEDWVNKKYKCNISIKYDYTKRGNVLLVDYFDGLDGNILSELETYCDTEGMKLQICRESKYNRVPLQIKPLSEYEY